MNQLPDEISITWGIADVREVAEDLTDDECRQVLQLAKDNHDATIGISWETLAIWAEQIRSERNQHVQA